VASLWEVQDDSTAKAAGAVLSGSAIDGFKGKLAAFTVARKQLKQEYPEPFFLGAVHLSGESELKASPPLRIREGGELFDVLQ